VGEGGVTEAHALEGGRKRRKLGAGGTVPLLVDSRCG
jgi:hypothetical protein